MWRARLDGRSRGARACGSGWISAWKGFWGVVPLKWDPRIDRLNIRESHFSEYTHNTGIGTLPDRLDSEWDRAWQYQLRIPPDARPENRTPALCLASRRICLPALCNAVSSGIRKLRPVLECNNLVDFACFVNYSPVYFTDIGHKALLGNKQG